MYTWHTGHNKDGCKGMDYLRTKDFRRMFGPEETSKENAITSSNTSKEVYQEIELYG